MAAVICERCDQGIKTKEGLRCNLLPPAAQESVIKIGRCDVASHGRIEGILESGNGEVIFSSKKPKVSVIYFE